LPVPLPFFLLVEILVRLQREEGFDGFCGWAHQAGRGGWSLE
jgi:hypothetical protein